MKLNLTTLVLVAAVAAAAVPAFARDAAQQAAQQAVALKDGSTLYVFKDGKMAKEDRFGRAVSLRNGDVLEALDGRKLTADSNEVSRLQGLLVEGHN